MDLTRHDGHRASASTTLRILRRPAWASRPASPGERRQLAAARRAAFTAPPSGPNQVWQLDFSEFDTTRGGTWRIAGCAEDWSTYEFGWHIGVTANQRDAVAAVELAITDRVRDGGVEVFATWSLAALATCSQREATTHRPQERDSRR
jgi:transposase InsO family protein